MSHDSALILAPPQTMAGPRGAERQDAVPKREISDATAPTLSTSVQWSRTATRAAGVLGGAILEDAIPHEQRRAAVQLHGAALGVVEEVLAGVAADDLDSFDRGTMLFVVRHLEGAVILGRGSLTIDHAGVGIAGDRTQCEQGAIRSDVKSRRGEERESHAEPVSLHFTRRGPRGKG